MGLWCKTKRVDISSFLLTELAEFLIGEGPVIATIEVAENHVNIIGCKFDLEIFNPENEVTLRDLSFLKMKKHCLMLTFLISNDLKA